MLGSKVNHLPREVGTLAGARAVAGCCSLPRLTFRPLLSSNNASLFGWRRRQVHLPGAAHETVIARCTSYLTVLLPQFAR